MVYAVNGACERARLVGAQQGSANPPHGREQLIECPLQHVAHDRIIVAVEGLGTAARDLHECDGDATKLTNDGRADLAVPHPWDTAECDLAHVACGRSGALRSAVRDARPFLGSESDLSHRSSHGAIRSQLMHRVAGRVASREYIGHCRLRLMITREPSARPCGARALRCIPPRPHRGPSPLACTATIPAAMAG